MPVDLTPEQAFRHMLDRQHVGADDVVHLAISGGMDSMALLHVARAVHPRLHVLHVDHGLRPDSVQDSRLVEVTARTLELPCTVHRIEGLRERAKGRGEGLEAAARAERYAWFATQMAPGGILLTGHHADDQRETRLLHWLRGSRPESWTGMANWSTERGFAIGRPFLEIPRGTLRTWMDRGGHRWREDPSNADPTHLRNRIRHELLPLLDDLRHGWESGMERHGRMAAEWTTATDALIDALPDPAMLPLTAVEAAPSRRMLLSRWAGRWSWPAARIEDLLNLAAPATEVGKEIRSTSYRMVRERGALRVIDVEPNAASPFWTLEEESGTLHTPWGTLGWSTRTGGVEPDPADHTAQLDLSRLTWPLYLRTWREGERLHPLGMEGQQSISDILTQRKVPHVDRDHALLVVQADGRPVWLVGHRIDRRTALPLDGNPADRVLCLTWDPA